MIWVEKENSYKDYVFIEFLKTVPLKTVPGKAFQQTVLANCMWQSFFIETF